MDDRVANDPTAERIGRGPVDAGGRERGAIDPCRVHIEGVEVYGGLLHRIECLPFGGPVPAIGVPALAHDPSLNRYSSRYARDCVGQRSCAGELDAAPAQGPHGEVSMPIDEPRRDESGRKLVVRECRRSLPNELRRPSDRPDYSVLPPESVALHSFHEREDAPGSKKPAGGSAGRFPHVENLEK